MMGGGRETRGEWPLLTAETEANGDSWCTYERKHSVFGSMGLTCPYNRFLSCFDSSCRPSTKYFFFLHRSLFHFIVPIAQKAGQAVVPRRLSLNISLWWGGGMGMKLWELLRWPLPAMRDFDHAGWLFKFYLTRAGNAISSELRSSCLG